MGNYRNVQMSKMRGRAMSLRVTKKLDCCFESRTECEAHAVIGLCGFPGPQTEGVAPVCCAA